MKCNPCKCEMVCLSMQDGWCQFACESCGGLATSSDPEHRPKVEPSPIGEILRHLSRMDLAERIHALREILRAEEARE